MADIQAWALLLEEPAERNFDRWEILGEYVWPNDQGTEERHSDAEEIAYLESWVAARAAWMDDAVQEL